MDQAEIDALLRAHGGRAHTVLSLHVLRAPTLSAAAHSFLAEHATELATIDYHRWLSHVATGQRAGVLDALAQYAAKEPSRFEHEIARAPRFPLEARERAALAVRLQGKVPASLLAALASLPAADGAPVRKAPSAPPAPAAAPAGEGLFDPSELLGDLDLGAGEGLGPAGAGGGGAGLGALSGPADVGFEDLFDPPGGGGDSASPSGRGGGLSAGRVPALAALLAELPATKSTRARSAWKSRARALAEDPAEDWGPVVTTLPADLREAVAVRAASSPRPEERAALLEWLFVNGAKLAELVPPTLALVRLPDKGGVRDWLAQSWIPKLLSDRSGWSKHGPSLLGALVDQGAFAEMDELFTAVLAGAAQAGPGLLSMNAEAPAVGPAVLLAFSRALAAIIEDGIATSRPRRALAGAAALACLGIPTKQRNHVLELRRKRAARGDVATLLALADTRPRRIEHSPRLEDLVATVHVLSDALS